MNIDRCYRCGGEGEQCWNICSLPGEHWICTDCDIALNAIVLAFMNVPDSARRLRRYTKRVKATAIRALDTSAAEGEGK